MPFTTLLLTAIAAIVVLGAPFQVRADDKGFAEVVTFDTEPDYPVGVYAVTYEGVKSGAKSIAYFRVTAP